MPFGSITTNSKTFNELEPGRYVLSTIVFGNPDNNIVARGAAKGVPTLRTSVTRNLQKDLDVDGDTVRKNAALTVSVVVPSVGFTAAEMRTLLTDLNGFLTEENLSQLLLGKS